MVTGDKNLFISGTEAWTRLELQRKQVDELVPIFWGRGNIWPVIPEGSFDIVTAQDPFWRGLFAWYVARKKNARFNIQVHVDVRAQPFSRRFLARIVLRQADSIRVVSERVKEQVTPYAYAPVSILPVFIDLEKIRRAIPADLKGDYPQFDKIILVASRLEPEKKVERAIDVMFKISQQFPRAGMLIAGKGSQEQELKEKVRKLGLEDKILFIGYRNDIASIYKAVDVLLLPSEFESYGASILEALEAGAPVVSEDIGIAKEAAIDPIVASFKDWDKAIIDIFTKNKKGKRRLSVLTAGEWGKKWKEIL